MKKAVISFEDIPDVQDVLESEEYSKYVSQEHIFNEEVQLFTVVIRSVQKAEEIVKEINRLGYESEILYYID